MELLAVLFVLGLLACLLIGFITVLTWLARLLGGASPKETEIKLKLPTSAPDICNGCGAAYSQQDLFCMQCGLRRGAQRGSAEADLIATQRALLRLFNLKRLDDHFYQTLTQTIEAEQARLRGEQTAQQRDRATERQTEPIVSPSRITASHPPRTPNAITDKDEAAAPLPPTVAPAPTEPRRSFTEMMAAFMEESSIRWGELVGGLLIIGCSLALVISLWSEIAERPILKFSIFMTLTAALFGLGFYSAHRWKLPTTSRGVLLTATLLVPLNFLAVTAFGRTSVSLGIVLAEIAAWVLFTVFVGYGAKVYAAEHTRWVTLSTMVASLSLLIAKHFVAPEMNWRNWLVLGALPVGGLLVSAGAALRQSRRTESLDAAHVYSIFALLGTGFFAALLPLGLLFMRGGLTRQVWRELVPLLALLSLPMLATGWFLWRRLRALPELATERTIAASLGISGAVLLAGSTFLAFPFLDAMLAVACLNAVVFGWAAWRYDLRLVRFVALAQAIYATLLILHLTLGRLTWGMTDGAALLNALFSTASGVFLLILFVGLIVFVEAGVARQALADDGEIAAWGCAALSLWMVTTNGFGRLGDPQHVVWVYATYALAFFAWAWRRKAHWLVWLGLGALLFTSVQACVYWLHPTWQWASPWAFTWLAYATTVSGLAWLAVARTDAQTLFGRPAVLTAGASAVWAALLVAVQAAWLSPWYLVPILFVALTWMLYAWRCDWTWAALGGGLLLNAVASNAVLIALAAQADVTESHLFVRLVQINVAVAASYALGWWWLARQRFTWMSQQITLVAIFQLIWLGGTMGRVCLEPAWSSELVRRVGGGWGWAVFALVAGAYALSRLTGKSHPGLAAGEISAPAVTSVSQRLLAALALGAQLAATAHRWESDNWLAYHVWLAALTLTAWLSLGWLWQLVRRDDVRATAATIWTNGLCWVSMILAWRAVDAPDGPWRSVAVLLAVSALMLGLQVVRRAPGYAYAAGALACSALTIWIYGYARGDGTLVDVLLLNGAVLAGIALVSLSIELRVLRVLGTVPKIHIPAFHQFVVALQLASLSVWLGVKLLSDFTRDFQSADLLAARGRYSLLIFVSLAALLIGCVWDAWHRWRFASLYVFGLLVIGALIDHRNLFGKQMLLSLVVASAFYALCAALAWRNRKSLAQALRTLHVPLIDWRGETGLWWLTSANAALAAFAVLLSLTLSLSNASFAQRLTAAAVSLLAPLALGWVIGQQQRTQWQFLSLLLGFGAILSGGWACIAPQGAHQLVIFTAFALTLGGLFMVGEAVPWRHWSTWLARLGSWEVALRRLVKVTTVAGLGGLLFVLGIEWLHTLEFGAVQQGTWAKACTTTLFIALLVSLLGFALWRGRDPFNWELTQRSRYVYAAEMVAVLLFVHVRLIAPWLFTGRFQAYWPVIILLLAFIGVGLGEQLRRRGRTVLADPLERTGVFLPLLPSLAFGLVKSNVDYAGVLLGVALFYGLLSVMRQSFGFGLLAVLAGNSGWWHWLQRTGDFGLFAHPQVWLIPAALSVLVAAHLNRQQLSQEQMTTIRYAALMTIYISSTADIFLNGVADSPWLPLILAVLSVVGVMLGMMLRVRAYLFLGTAFLLLAIITMVWHAAVSFGWRWLWYVAGIAFGMMIIYLFAMFERHRASWLLWMERFKTWQA